MEMKVNDYKRAEIDPAMWPTAKTEIAAVWVKSVFCPSVEDRRGSSEYSRCFSAKKI
jgi:hypothetical protein